MAKEHDNLLDLLPDAIVTVASDGRLFFHDLDPTLIEIALAINPNDAAMKQRLEQVRQATVAGNTEKK